MPHRIQEATTLAVAPTAEGETKPGRLQIGLITPGWGSSGYYSDKVLENAARAKVFPAGTKMFLDHPSESERHDRPERSVRDLAAVLTEDARWDGSGLVAEARVIGPYRDLLTDETLVENIGVSIAAYAETTIGEAEGRKGTIVTRLNEAFSVDFVTFPGRGGAVLAVIESARRDVTEASANDTREALQAAVRAAYGDTDVWVWLRDYDVDAQVLWFSIEDADSLTTYQQGYSLDDDGTAQLADGDPTEVRPVTQYVPVASGDDAATEAAPSVSAPAEQSTATESQEDHMATTQIEESRLRQLETDAGRVQTLESERDTAIRERDEAREANAARDRRDAARAVIAREANDAGVAFTALEERGLLAELPVVDGALDEAAYTATVKEAAAAKADAAGAGQVVGFGTGTTTQVAESYLKDFDEAFRYDATQEA